MTKIMLVEDDNNLREIYGARLMAEGYQIVSAADGEEALALAVKEKPELIVADVMMPKISGFDMLDILRTTPETKDTKVIIMTALSQPEDRARGESLGADKYLVKSQVTLEDVVAAVHEILGDGGGSTPPAATVNETMPLGSSQPPAPAPAPPPPAEPPTTDTGTPQAADDQPPKAEGASDAPEPASKKKLVIKPINDLSHEKEDLLKMAAEEEAREKQSTPGASVGPANDTSQDEQQAKMAESMAEEKKRMEEDVKKMVNDGTIDDEATAPAVQPDNNTPAQSDDGPGPGVDMSATAPQSGTGQQSVPQPPVAPAQPASPEPDAPAAPVEVPEPGSSVSPQPDGGNTGAGVDVPAESSPAAKGATDAPAQTEQPSAESAPEVPQPPEEEAPADPSSPNPNDVAL
ncbi:MAG TPA: response regulator [Candidatus Saccharimonadales bacterium]|jgi:CheY-like chemotaxis protein